MFLLKFLTISLSAAINNSNCIKEEIDSTIYLSSLPKLIASSFKLQKTNCTIKIISSTLWNKYWEVDICKVPIHLKHADLINSKILHRQSDCSDRIDDHQNSKEPFCLQLQELLSFMQKGLIHSTGNKYDMSSENGKLYCAYILLHNYLKEGIVFDLYDNFNLLDEATILKEFSANK